MKKTRLLAVLALTAALSSACGQAATNTNTNAGTENTASAPEVNAGTTTVSEQPSETRLTVHYFVGDEDLAALVDKTAEIAFAKEEDKYLAALQTLQLEDGSGGVSLWKNAVFLSASLTDGKLTVDLSLPDNARLGAPGESLALDAITRTAFQFEEVDALDILVDGEVVDSLMGHEELEHPIVKET